MFLLIINHYLYSSSHSSIRKLDYRFRNEIASMQQRYCYYLYRNEVNRPISLVVILPARSCTAAVLIFSHGKCVGVAKNSVAWRHQAGVDRRSVVRDRSQLLNWFFDPHNVTNAWPRLSVLNAENRWNETMPIEPAFNFLHSLTLEETSVDKSLWMLVDFFSKWHNMYVMLNENNW